MFRNKTDDFSQAVDCQDEEQEPGVRNCPSAISSYTSSVFSNSLCSLTRSDTHDMVNILLGEFRIKHSELEFGQTIKTGPLSTIHQGRWHGEVVIHSCAPRDDEEVQSWLADVRALTHIRHENVVLYMGACVEPPKFAIITSPIKVNKRNKS